MAGIRIPRAEREQQMLDAAEFVFAQKDFRAASMDEIAERSGITKPLLYQYFGSKEALYDACVERGRDALFSDIEQAAEAVAPDQALRIFVAKHFEFLEANRGSWWLLYGESTREATDAMRERNAQLALKFLRRAAEAADRRCSDAALVMCAHALIGAGEQVGRWWLNDPSVTKDEAAARFEAMATAVVAQVLLDGELS